MHKTSTAPGAFTLAIQGSGNLILPFRLALMARHPDATVYDRRQEVSEWKQKVSEWKKSSPFLPPAHPEVADIDVFFRLSGQCDEITLHCRGQHRFFSFNPDHPQNDEVRLERLLQAIIDTAEQLLKDASAPPPELPGESEPATEQPDQSLEPD